MNALKPAGNDGKRKIAVMLRRMGMSLAVCGALILSAGLVACRQISEEVPFVRPVLILVSGITMLIVGVHIWRSTKEAG